MQVGGRLLGQGVYGCTFDPAPRCAGGSVFKTISGLPAVGKVTSEDIADELGVGKEIMALPMAKQYFALPSVGCKLSSDGVNDPDANKCRVITESGEGTTFSMLIMPAAGEQLLKWSLNLPRLAEDYRRGFVHLLEGMIIYQRAGFVHNDIHMGNVLVDEVGVARFIDFGLAFKVEDVKVWEDSNLGTRFRPKYIWQAPEVHTWRMVKNGVRVVDGVKQMRDINAELGRIEHQFPNRVPADVALSNLVKTSPEFVNMDGVGFIRRFGKKFDSWRIGLLMWMLWDDLLHWSGFMLTDTWRQRDVFRRVLGGLTDFDPQSRLTATEALRILDPANRLASASA
jgi:hypothetical protein